MPFALSSNPSQSEVSDAINYLLCNFGSNVSIDVNTGIVAGPTGNLGYLYKYLFIKYATASDGSVGFSNVPTGATYFGTRNSNSNTESTNPTDYVWTQVTGGFGTTKFIWYSTNGGRQVNTVVSVGSPGLSYLVDPGTAIDLDVVTGTNALMGASPTIYKWTSGSAPTRPTTTSTYTWATGSFTPPTGWTSSISSDTTPGDTLWAIIYPLIVLANTATSTLDWTDVSYPIVQIGQNGSTGSTGGSGLSSLSGYKVQFQSASTPTFTTPTSGAALPTGWYSTLSGALSAVGLSALTPGYVVWYIFGQYNSTSATLSGVPANSTAWTGPTAASIFQDILSDNWNGSIPMPSSGGTVGTLGWYISKTTGNVYANNGLFRGDITGASGTFAGSVTSTIYSNKVTLNESSTNWLSVYATGGSSIFSILGDGTNYVQAQLNGNNSTLGAFRVFNTGGAAAVYGANTGTGYGVYGNTLAAGSYGVYGVNAGGGTAMYSGGPFGTSSNALVTNLYAQYTLNLKRQGSGSGDLYFYTGPTTGSAPVITFDPTNKPGSTGGSNTWVEVVINGSSYQIPVWAS